jgi:transcription antitermination factor NusG
MPLDIRSGTALSGPQHDSADSLASPRMSCGSRWHCIATQPHQEFAAVGELARQHYRTFLPLHLERGNHRPDRIVPLFCRYAFVAFDPMRDPWGSIRHTRGVLALIRHAPESPTPLPAGVVEHLMARTSARGVVDDPGDAPAVSHIPLGAAVSVVHGPLAGLAGVVALSSANRVCVLLRLLGREVRANLDPQHVRAA